ncbi:MAG: UDP-N-acetylmuramoyl-L-alanine--D-glutamate ligase [Chromatiales bacterium]|nr:UDP-N-acetylmuramoyl-L-alanine--D-glutamate ligase [Gammaproteobacteria bacterium]MBW6476342.1 UDP-N-acetylmuramoyl-L-alanine--D-glutamate ligase [Chromatiales bacterium]
MTTHQHSAHDAYQLVVGLGKTGLSCVRFLRARGEPVVVVDSRENPPGLAEFQSEFPDLALHCGPFEERLFHGASRIILSPGVAPQQAHIAACIAAGIAVIGDIELFARHVAAPVIAITGSNGKSTVTMLLAEMAKHAGMEALVGGNIGTPALDLLGMAKPRFYILELSSFQLEMTSSLNCAAAVVLNISEDHLDRHRDLAEYAAIKARIFRGDGVMVINQDDPLVRAMAEAGRETWQYGMASPEEEHIYGLRQHQGEDWLARGHTLLMACKDIRIPGRHNQSNALAALALGEACGMALKPRLQALREFAGLPHRCQWVSQRNGVDYYNDSKGTNVGASLAAIAGVPGEKLVVILGGQGKGQDFSPLCEVLQARARAVILIGEDAPLLARVLDGCCTLQHATTLAEAVSMAGQCAQAGDSVLLSPACASFDMFRDYQQRGEQFCALLGEEAA